MPYLRRGHQSSDCDLRKRAAGATERIMSFCMQSDILSSPSFVFYALRDLTARINIERRASSFKAPNTAGDMMLCLKR